MPLKMSFLPDSRPSHGVLAAEVAELRRVNRSLLVACQGLLADCNLTISGHGGRMDAAIAAARLAVLRVQS